MNKTHTYIHMVGSAIGIFTETSHESPFSTPRLKLSFAARGTPIIAHYKISFLDLILMNS